MDTGQKRIAVFRFHNTSLPKKRADKQGGINMKKSRLLCLLLALVLMLSQSASALAYATGTWPSGFEAAGCTAQDALIRNEGKHWYNCTEYVDPWCESVGYAVFTCVYCGDTRTEYYPPVGHLWGDEWYMTQEPSCGVPGSESRYCYRCQKEETRSTPALQHDWSEWDENEYPTCTEPGEEIRFCNNCWQEETRPIPALGHDWGDWQTLNDASCGVEGTEIRFCRRCQMEQTRATAALSHDWGSWETEQAATCTLSGMEFRYCRNCWAEEFRDTPPLGHNWMDWQTIKAPTCTESGVQARYCARCQLEQTRETDPLNHNWGPWKEESPGTCVERRMEVRACVNCGKEEYRYAGYGDHNWGEWETVKEPTATEAGLEKRVCKYSADHVEEREIPPTGQPDPSTGTPVWSDEKISLTVQKVWNDGNDADGLRPDTLRVALTRGGDVIGNAVLSAENGWQCEIGEVARYDETGREIEYVWVELDETEGYEASFAAQGNVTIITNSRVPEEQQGKAELTISLEVREGNSPYAPKTEFKDGEDFWVYGSVTNTGEVDVELYDCDLSTTDGWSLQGSHSGVRYLLKPGETVDHWGGFWFVSHSETAYISNVTPGTETETLAGTIGFSVTVPGYKPGTDEVICTASASTEFGVLKDSEKEQDHGLSVVVTWDEGAGEGKRYEGAVIPLYFTCTNIGSVPVRTSLYDSGDTELQPGESVNYSYDWSVTAKEADEGVVHTATSRAGGNKWDWGYDYQDAEGYWHEDSTLSNEVTIPLTYPDGVEPEPDKPELTLTYLYDDPAKDVYDPEDSVFAYYSLVNTGNVPLHVVAHFTSEGVRDYDTEKGIFDPGKTYGKGWGWWTIRKGITPGTETEDLLGTVTIHYYFKGLDPDTGEELCRTQTVSRTWKVAKPPEGPIPWPIPEESDITVELTEYTTPADPNGYQLGEWWNTTLTRTNTGNVDIPEYHVYDPYDEWEMTCEGLKVGETYSWPGAWSSGIITQEDVDRGYIYLPPVQITWIDPDSGNEKIAYSNDLTLMVIGKTGLVVTKGIGKLPANGAYFTEGETIDYVITVTNTSEEPVKNVTVTDQGETLGTFDQIAPGETVACNYSYTVTDYDAWVGSVTNIAEATGTDFRDAEHTWPSNPVSVPTKDGSPVPLPPPYTPGDPDPDDPGKGKDPSPGDPKPNPGDPETPEHPGTPGGGEDPNGPIHGYNVAATLYKTTTHMPKNLEYYELGETVDYIIELTNTGETALENIVVYDSLAGFAPIDGAASLAPGETKMFTFAHVVTQEDIGAGYVVNSAIVTYTFGGGISGTPVNSNPVYVIAGKDGKIPDPGKTGDPDGNTPGGTPGGTDGLIPPVHFDPDKLHGDPGGTLGGEGPVSCELQLNALGDSGANYTLHACAEHTAAAAEAEAAILAGDFKQAGDVWRREIEALYEKLYDAGDSEGKAAVMSDRAAFDAYVAAFQALYGDEAAADLLRLRCAELCCMVKTASKPLPSSILGSYAHLMNAPAEKCGREIGALNGSDAVMTERYDAAHGADMAEVIRLAQSAKYGPAQENAFSQAQRRWQMALDGVVNLQYKAADKETRKLIAAARVALDNVYAARKPLLDFLYPGAPETVAEALSGLYKDALIDACGNK